MTLVIHRQDGTVDNVPVICRLDTQDEVEMLTLAVCSTFCKGVYCWRSGLVTNLRTF